MAGVVPQKVVSLWWVLEVVVVGRRVEIGDGILGSIPLQGGRNLLFDDHVGDENGVNFLGKRLQNGEVW